MPYRLANPSLPRTASGGHELQHMSKYAPLANYLKRQTRDRVRLTFRKVEGIINDALPRSARQHIAWWENSRTPDTHTWAHLWLQAGWEREHLNLGEEWVEFRRTEFFELESPKAREGYEVDRAILARARNAGIAEARKKRDNYTCQACNFRLELGGRFVIEVHHVDPLAVAGETVTTIRDLVSLCPTCHRIAHLRSHPYDVREIQELRSQIRGHA